MVWGGGDELVDKLVEWSIRNARIRIDTGSARFAIENESHGKMDKRRKSKFANAIYSEAQSANRLASSRFSRTPHSANHFYGPHTKRIHP